MLYNKGVCMKRIKTYISIILYKLGVTKTVLHDGNTSFIHIMQELEKGL